MARALAFAAVAFAAAGCAVVGPVEGEARRAEGAVEQPPVALLAPAVPVLTNPGAAAPSPPPARLTPAAPARPLAALARGGGAEPSAVYAVVDDLLFAPGSAALEARSRTGLDALAARLAALGDYRLEVQGHTDASGGELLNIEIGLRRAEAVRRYLAERHAIPRSRIAVVSLGSAQPATDDASAGGRARNRRAVVLVLK